MCSWSVFAVTANVASRSPLHSGCRQLFWQYAFLFLCNLSIVLPENAHSGYVAPCQNRVARVRLRCVTRSRHQERCGTLKVTTVLWFDRHDMAKQDMAPRREETSGTADTPYFVARQQETRQLGTLHDFKVEMTQTVTGPCDTNGQAGKHVKFHSGDCLRVPQKSIESDCHSGVHIGAQNSDRLMQSVLTRSDRFVPIHANFSQPTLAADKLLWTSCGGPSMCPDRGRR